MTIARSTPPLHTANVGHAIARTDGPAKVRGETRYVDDQPFTGWYGATVRSPGARGRITGLRFKDGVDWRAFVIVTHRDIPRFARPIARAADASHGKAADHAAPETVDLDRVALIEWDQPYLVRDEFRHKHEAVALIAHPDREMAKKAAALVEVQWEPLPAVLDYRQQPGAGQVQHGSDNVFKRYLLCKGAAEQGDSALADVFASAAHVVEGTYETGAQEQAYIEPQGMIATVKLDVHDAAHPNWPEHGFHVRVEGSLQCPYYVHQALKHLFNLPDESVQVVQAATGGGFGGKEDYPSLIAGHAALLSWKARQPVKMVYDRVEDMQCTTKRHPCRTRVRTAHGRDGKLLALDADVCMDGGAYVTLSPVVLSRGTIHIGGPYEIPHVRVESKVVLSNTPPNGAFRGFGAPQTIFAMERHLDVVAARLAIDPAELRRRNLIVRGGTLATGQVIDEPVDLHTWLERALAAIDWHKKRNDHQKFNSDQVRSGLPLRRGVGVATFMHGCGFTGSGEVFLASKLDVRATRDGKVEVLAANTEIGQGAETVFGTIAADTLGLELGDIVVARPDTARVPNSGPTVASRTSMVVGHLVAKACDDLVGKLEATGLIDASHLRPLDGAVSVQAQGRGRAYEPAELRRAIRRAGEMAALGAHGGATAVGRSEYEPPPGVVWDDKTYRGTAYGTYAWATYAADVEVDTTTFEVKVKDFVALQEIGKVLHPVLAKGQIAGGVVQGLGWALLEQVVNDDGGGMANANLTTYVLPTVADVPMVRVLFEEQPYGYGPFGAKGLGELPMDGPAPAVINAIAMALGVQPMAIPATPERLLALCVPGANEHEASEAR
jgi:CO/xanthine dehydrogenase Mo-binding subunit